MRHCANAYSCFCRQLVLAADARGIQQWLLDVDVSSFTAGTAEQRQRVAEAAAAAMASQTVKSGAAGEEGLRQLLALSTRCALRSMQLCCLLNH